MRVIKTSEYYFYTLMKNFHFKQNYIRIFSGTKLLIVLNLLMILMNDA